MNPYQSYRYHRRIQRQERSNLRELRGRLAHAEAAQALIQELAKAIQATAQTRVSSLVSRCLTEVFGTSAYEFRLVLEAKRGKTEARPVFVRNGKILNPVDESGLGQVDVAAFALRVACLLLQTPPVARRLALDEPFRYVSKNYRPKLAQLVESLATELGMQFLVVTHDDEFLVGNVIRID